MNKVKKKKEKNSTKSEPKHVGIAVVSRKKNQKKKQNKNQKHKKNTKEYHGYGLLGRFFFFVCCLGFVFVVGWLVGRRICAAGYPPVRDISDPAEGDIVAAALNDAQKLDCKARAHKHRKVKLHADRPNIRLNLKVHQKKRR